MKIGFVLWLAASALVLALSACASQSDLAESQFAPIKDGQYTNPYIDDPDKSFFDYWGMRLFGETEFANHASQVDRIQVTSKRVDLTSAGQPKVIWLGHSSFLIQTGERNILTDPVFSERASPVSFAGPKRLAPMPYSIGDLPEIDVVLISHNHYDHLDEDTIRRLGSAPRYYVPLGLKDWFDELGIDSEKVSELDWWQHHQGQEYRVTATPAQHWSARSLFDRRETFWAGWHIQMGERSIWFAGDTGYNSVQFKQIGQRFPDIDLALIPIGSYSPRWFMKPYHVNPEEAVQIHKEVGAKLSIGMHWSTFQLSAEDLDEPARRLQQVMSLSPALNPFITLPIGGHLRLTD